MHLDALWLDQQGHRVRGGLGDGTDQARVVLDLHPIDEGGASVLGGGRGWRATLQDHLKDLGCFGEGWICGGYARHTCSEGEKESSTQKTTD